MTEGQDESSIAQLFQSGAIITVASPIKTINLSVNCTARLILFTIFCIIRWFPALEKSIFEKQVTRTGSGYLFFQD